VDVIFSLSEAEARMASSLSALQYWLASTPSLGSLEHLGEVGVRKHPPLMRSPSRRTKL
jgi:hypothetical protein